MTEIVIERLSSENFSEFSMDGFMRYQEIKESCMLENGEYVLRPNPHILDWDVEACRSTAREILKGMADGGFAYGAFSGDDFLGYILIGGKFIGREGDALQLKLFHMTNGLRGQGVGKRLFAARQESAGRRSFIFPPMLQRKARLPTGRWAACMQRNLSTRFTARRPMTCRWNMYCEGMRATDCAGRRFEEVYIC